MMMEFIFIFLCTYIGCENIIGAPKMYDNYLYYKIDTLSNFIIPHKVIALNIFDFASFLVNSTSFLSHEQIYKTD